jgi:DNA polymerase alpha subunit A
VETATPAAPVEAAVTRPSKRVAKDLTQDAPTIAPVDGQAFQQHNATVKAGEDLLFYWLDASEDRQNKKGTVFLFGKVRDSTGKFVSASLAVRDVERTMYVVPRDVDRDEHGNETKPADIAKVYAEIDAIRKRLNIQRFKSMPVKRKYAFEEKSVPHGETTMLMIQYGANEPGWPLEHLSGETFSYVLGRETPSLERFLIEREVMGPCWLRISGVQRVEPRDRLTHCKEEFFVSDMELVTPLPAIEQQDMEVPDARVVSLVVRTVYNARTRKNEVVAVSGVVHGSVSITGPTKDPRALAAFTAVRPLSATTPLPADFKATLSATRTDRAGHIDVVANERALMSYLLAKLDVIDPDVVVGHSFTGFTLDVLLHRLKEHKLNLWSKLGRVRRKHIPKLQSGPGGQAESTWEERRVMQGRLVVDTYEISKELLRLRDYSLATLCRDQLGVERQDVDFNRSADYFQTTTSLLGFLDHARQDALLALQLQFKLQVLPLTKSLTNVAGNVWSSSLQGQRAQRVAFLLMHEFHSNGYVLPDKESRALREAKKRMAEGDDEDGGEMGDRSAAAGGGGGGHKRQKAKYAGGLVLDPQVGFYERYVVVLDFNSLYPSIVRAHNVCYTTVHRSYDEFGEPIGLANPPAPEVAEGILPRTIGRLVEQRRAAKAQMKAEKPGSVRREQIDIRQMSLKLVANSMYGCLGFEGSRFYCRPLAELVTRKGRDTLQATVELATKSDVHVIYGDTDSIMLYTGMTDPAAVLKKADALKREINAKFAREAHGKSHIEIDIDHVFKKMLLLKKKKYAALSLAAPYTDETKVHVEMKGLDLVRRDWCVLTRKMGVEVLNFLFNEEATDAESAVGQVIKYCEQRADDIREGRVPLADYVITKTLTRSVEDYTGKGMFHVEAARKLIEAKKRVAPGDQIGYIVCTGAGVPPGTSPAERAYTIEMVQAAEGALEVDYEWYFGQQLIPPISRLIDPIDGIDDGQLAVAFGLDPTKYKQAAAARAGSARVDRAEEDLLESMQSLDDAVRYSKCKPLRICCPGCKEVYSFESYHSGEPKVEEVNGHKITLLADGATGLVECGATCPKCHTDVVDTVHRAISGSVRAFIRQYYDQDHVCSNANRGCPSQQLEKSHSRRFHFVPSEGSGELRCVYPGCSGVLTPVMSSTRLLLQLQYYKWLLNVLDRRRMSAAVHSDTREALWNRINEAYGTVLDNQFLRESLHSSATFKMSGKSVFGGIAATAGSRSIGVVSLSTS